MDITPSSLRISPWQIFILLFLHRPCCDNTHASCISIYHTWLFPTKLALWLGHRIFSLLTLHMSPNVPYGLLASSDTVACVSTTSLAWEMLLSCNIMQHHATFLFGILCWCTCHVSIILIKLSSISPRYTLTDHVCFLAQMCVIRCAT